MGGYGIGFGSTNSMTDVYALLVDDSTAQDRILGNRFAGSLVSEDNWSLDCIADDGDPVIIVVSRVNEVPDCDGENGAPDCFSFDPTRPKLKMIYACGDGLVTERSKHTEKGGVWLDAIDNAGTAPICDGQEIDTPSPTMIDEEPTTTS